MQETTGALILAAGRGTRMPSPRPKALQTLLGESMLALILEETAKLSGLAGIWTLVGHQAELVRAEAERAAAALPPSHADAPRIFCIEQKEQLG
ncbi:MAG TPA: NTP transferase domain-containing protein, partial [Candidatus Mailhella excrementigallinarum]|nr:NTP transferase domain-containing protein [Candidatus Mailhella excrementigallinarum]